MAGRHHDDPADELHRRCIAAGGDLRGQLRRLQEVEKSEAPGASLVNEVRGRLFRAHTPTQPMPLMGQPPISRHR